MVEYYSSAEMQSAYSIVPADKATFCESPGGVSIQQQWHDHSLDEIPFCFVKNIIFLYDRQPVHGSPRLSSRAYIEIVF